jgi:hypothetical protein
MDASPCVGPYCCFVTQPPPQQPPPNPQPAKRKRFGFLALGLTAAAAVVIGSLFGAAGDNGTIAAEPMATVTATATATKTVTEPGGEEPASEPTEEPTEESGSDTARFGAANGWRYENDLEVSVLSAKKSSAGVVITTRIKNGTGSTYDAESAHVTLSYGPDGEQAENTYRFDGEYPFTGRIAKGKSKTAKQEYKVPAKHRDELTVEVVPDYESEAALFEGKAS